MGIHILWYVTFAISSTSTTLVQTLFLHCNNAPSSTHNYRHITQNSYGIVTHNPAHSKPYKPVKRDYTLPIDEYRVYVG